MMNNSYVFITCNIRHHSDRTNMLSLMVNLSLFHNTLITMAIHWVVFWGPFTWQLQVMLQEELWGLQEVHLDYCYHAVKIFRS